MPSALVENSVVKNASECRSVPCSIPSACFPCFRGRSRQTVRQRFLRHGKIARRFCRLNEKRGQLLEALPFQSSKSWLPSFLASRLSPPSLFLCMCKLARSATTFLLQVLPFRAIPLFPPSPSSRSWSLTSKKERAETRC